MGKGGPSLLNISAPSEPKQDSIKRGNSSSSYGDLRKSITPPGQSVADVNRNITKANDIIPKESISRPSFPTSKPPATVLVSSKPKIPYSKTIMTPGPERLTNIVPALSQIPRSANPTRATSEWSKKKSLRNSIKKSLI